MKFILMIRNIQLRITPQHLAKSKYPTHRDQNNCLSIRRAEGIKDPHKAHSTHSRRSSYQHHLQPAFAPSPDILRPRPARVETRLPVPESEEAESHESERPVECLRDLRLIDEEVRDEGEEAA